MAVTVSRQLETVVIGETECLSLADAQIVLGKSGQWTRAMVHDGTLASLRDERERIYVPMSAIAEFQAAEASGERRRGRQKTAGGPTYAQMPPVLRQIKSVRINIAKLDAFQALSPEAQGVVLGLFNDYTSLKTAQFKARQAAKAAKAAKAEVDESAEAGAA